MDIELIKRFLKVVEKSKDCGLYPWIEIFSDNSGQIKGSEDRELYCFHDNADLLEFMNDYLGEKIGPEDSEEELTREVLAKLESLSA